MESSGMMWASREDLVALEDRVDKRLTKMEQEQRDARKEHSAQHKDLYDKIDTTGSNLEGKIDEWRKELNGRVNILERWQIGIVAIMSIFTKGFRNRTLLTFVAVLLAIGGILWKQTSNEVCELRNNNIARIELSYQQGRVTKTYRDIQVNALKQIAC